MFAIFSFCSIQQYLNISNFETDNVTNMSIIFLKCHKLKEIKGINKYNINKVINMEDMFE